MLTFLIWTGLLAQNSLAPDWLAELERLDRAVQADRNADLDAAFKRVQRMADQHGAGELPSGVAAFQAGKYYYRRAEFLAAERCYEHALEVLSARLGPTHHTSVDVVIQLSSTYLETGKVSKSAALLQARLAASGELAREDRAALLGDLGSVLLSQGRYAESEAAYRQALAVFEHDPQAQSRERTLIALSNLSGVYLKTGRTGEAVQVLDRARQLLAKLPNAAPELTVKTLANAAAAYAAAKTNPQMAEALYQSAIRACERAFSPDHFLLGQILLNYAEFLHGEKRKADAAAARKRGAAIQTAFAKQNLLNYTVEASVLNPNLGQGRK